MLLHLALIKTTDAICVRHAATPEALVPELAGYCREWWETEMEDIEMPEPDQEVIDTYFGDDARHEEWVEFDTIEIKTLCEALNFSDQKSEINNPQSSILNFFKDALDTLLTETVDKDLKHGIELSEGEEAARNQALACFLIHPLGQAEPKEPTPEEVAATILAEIRQDEQLAACHTFAELGDHCDHNMLGCSPLLLDAFGMEKTVHILNAAQQIVTAALPITEPYP